MTPAEAGTHYEVLGVAATASAEEIRRAYVAAARANHPDLASDGQAQRRMQRINEAWSVLGDEASRRDYDRSLRGPVAPSTPGRASEEFVPFDDGEDPEDPAAEADVPYGDGKTLAPAIQMAPAVALVAGFMAAGAGAMFQSSALLGLGAFGIVAGLIAFGAIPLYVAMRSHDHAR